MCRPSHYAAVTLQTSAVKLYGTNVILTVQVILPLGIEFQIIARINFKELQKVC